MKSIHFLACICSLFYLGVCSQNLTTEQSWVYGFLVGLGISLMGFAAALLLVCIRNLITPESFIIFVNMLYSLGCGAIIGDAVIHILPEAYKDTGADSKLVSLIFICAVLFFLII
jgi:zinc transporter ZupT